MKISYFGLDNLRRYMSKNYRRLDKLLKKSRLDKMSKRFFKSTEVPSKLNKTHPLGAFLCGAGDGIRTRTNSLEGYCASH